MSDEDKSIPTALALGYAAAHRLAPGHRDHDDIAQEAAIRVAEVQARKPDASTAYLAGVARHRVLDMVRGCPYTGSTSGRNVVDPLRRTETAHLGDETLYFLDEEEGFERAEWSTLGPEIEEAIAQIPCTTETPRQVTRLVAAGFSASEAGRQLGLSTIGGRKAWQLARAHMEMSLAHLRPEVAA